MSNAVKTDTCYTASRNGQPLKECAPIPAWIAGGVVPSVNGLRAVSILVVIFAHGLMQRRHSMLYLPIDHSTAVDIFFVVSGFLITLLLLREKAYTGSVSIRAFYIRRVMRIVPAYLTYVLFVFLLTSTGATNPTNLLRVLTYTTNLYPSVGWDTNHSWSLCIEEHFYLVWPLLFALCGTRVAGIAAFACVAFSPPIRVAMRLLASGLIEEWKFTLCRMDPIAAGCLLAIGVMSPRLQFLIHSFRNWDRIALLGFVGLAIYDHVFMFVSPRVEAVEFAGMAVGGSFRSIVISVMVLACVSASGLVRAILNHWVMDMLGTLSYSLYLWQQIFLNPSRLHMFPFPVSVFLIAASALASYYVVERPLLALKERLLRRRNGV